MKEVELKPSQKIKVKRGGVEYELRKLKLGEIYALEKKTKELKESGDQGNADLIELLVKLGLPEEVVLDLDSDELNEVVGVIGASKKNG